MKIISKSKDYYDYLVGVYGEDPKLILDRRYSHNIYPSEGIIKVFFCGLLYKGFFKGGTPYFGTSLSEISEKSEDDIQYKHFRYPGVGYGSQELGNQIEGVDYFTVSDATRMVSISIHPIKDDLNINEKMGIPILVQFPRDYYQREGDFLKYPSLKDLKFNNVVTPEDAFLKLSDWLSQELTRKENQIPEVDDINKLQSKGFDKKKSFRPKMK